MAGSEASAHQMPADSGGGRPGGPISLSIAAHPRAARRVRQAREAAGLIGFLLGGWMSLGTHTPLDVILRALAAGIACQLIVWAAAVLIWRHLIVAEVKDREHALLQAAAELRGRPAERQLGDGRAIDAASELTGR